MGRNLDGFVCGLIWVLCVAKFCVGAEENDEKHQDN